jgi:ABC-type uncharacterized transport system substrate-binding protein
MSKRARWWASAAALAVVLVVAPPAAAHPHIWIEHAVTVVMGPAGIEGVRFTWEFDPLFSNLIFQEFDADRDKKFAPSEVRAIEAKHLDNLKAYDYFVEVKLQGAPVPVTVKDFQVSVGSNGQVSYAFTVPIKGPVTPASLDIAVHDPTYFTAFALRASAPVAVQSSRQFTAECKVVADASAAAGEAVKCSSRRIAG